MTFTFSLRILFVCRNKNKKIILLLNLKSHEA